MKKVKLLLSLAGFLFLITLFYAPSALADQLVVDVDPPDLNAIFWNGSDVNPSDQLVNSNETTEEAWLEALLGLNYDNPGLNLIDRLIPGGDQQELTDYSPGFTWDWAVVKYGNSWSGYEDTGNDNLLSVGPLSNAVSHVTFFEGGQAVPEPATMFLLGFGMIGMVPFIRRKFKK